MPPTDTLSTAQRDLAASLAPFILSESERSEVLEHFELAVAECHFAKEGDVIHALERFHGVPGIYFWLLRRGEQRFKIYLGQTTSLSYRLTNYISDFQPHAPNDFKLRIFHDFVVERLTGACFELHFERLAKPDASLAEVRRTLTEAENSTRKRFAPTLLNERGRPSAAAKLSLQRAFTDYYRSGFEALFESAANISAPDA